MKTHNPKPSPLFSCGIFRHCTQTQLSPTTPNSPLSFPQQQPLAPPHPESSSSSSSTSQSFTQWKIPLSPPSPLHPNFTSIPDKKSELPIKPDLLPVADIQEIFHVAEVQLSTGTDLEKLSALHLLERSLVPDPTSNPVCPPKLMFGVVSSLRNKSGVKPATKVLLALCLVECNRPIAVEAGAVRVVAETVMELEGPAAERALAALELMCTMAEGAAEVRAHALAVPVMVTMMGKMGARGREYAISVLGVIYGGGGGNEEESAVTAPAEEVARAVVLALQGESTTRGRRKGAHLLKTLEEGYGNGRDSVSVDQ